MYQKWKKHKNIESPRQLINSFSKEERTKEERWDEHSFALLNSDKISRLESGSMTNKIKFNELSKKWWSQCY